MYLAAINSLAERTLCDPATGPFTGNMVALQATNCMRTGCVPVQLDAWGRRVDDLGSHSGMIHHRQLSQLCQLITEQPGYDLSGLSLSFNFKFVHSPNRLLQIQNR